MDGNEATPVRYRIDTSQSRFTVQASADGLLSMFGHNPIIAIRGFGGDAKFLPGTLGAASLLMLVQANSLAVTGKVSDKDRREIERMMHQDVLKTALYPEIVYASTSVSVNQITADQYQVQITGNLSLHGVTRQCPINAQVTMNGHSLRAQGKFSLKQTDYQMKPVSVAGGTLKVKDNLQFSFDIVAHEQRL